MEMSEEQEGTRVFRREEDGLPDAARELGDSSQAAPSSQQSLLIQTGEQLCKPQFPPPLLSRVSPPCLHHLLLEQPEGPNFG